MLKRLITATIGVICTFAFLVNVPQPTKAQTAPATAGISVIPPSFELFANPGDSVTDKIKVRNSADASATYQILVEDFKAVGEEGSVDVIEDEESNSSYSLAKWVTAEPKKFTLAAKSEKEISFTINVPKNAEPGGHYCSILVSIGEDAKAQQNGAAVASRVGSLVLLRVSGNVKEDAGVESFAATKGYYEKGPITFNLRVKDNGNNHIKPKGTIVITNLFGQKVAEIPLNGLNVLPDAIRRMETEWRPTGFMASRYTATLVATYGSQNKPLSASASFIVLPKYIAVALIIIVVLFLLLVGGRKQIKRILHNLTR